MTGRELRALLAAKGRTHEDLAAHIGRSTRTISRMVARDGEPVPRYIEMAVKSLPTLVKSLVDADDAPRTPPVDDLFGRTDRGTPPRREAEPTIRGDQRQTTIPGTKGSAVQAQAGRDQTGTGRLQPKVDQKPADQGLFAKPETPWTPSLLIDMPTPADSIEKLQDWIREAEQSPFRSDQGLQRAIKTVRGYLRDRPKLGRQFKAASSSRRTP